MTTTSTSKTKKEKRQAKRFRFTEPAVKKLKAKSVQYDCWDTHRSPSGFGVRITPSGTQSWQIVCRIYHPDTTRWIPTRMIIGRVGEVTLTDARDKAYDLKKQAKAALDVRPGAQRAVDMARADAEHAAREAAKVNSFGAVRAAYLAHQAKKNRPATVDNYTDHLARCRAWEDKPIDSITKLDVQVVIDALLTSGKNRTARMVHQTLRQMFLWAKDNDRFPGDIPVKKERPGVADRTRDRFLTDAEIGVFWRASEKLDPVRSAIMQVLLLLGQRSGETAGMRWSELKLEGDAPTWAIPAERAKNGKEHILPLPRAAVAILQAIPKRRGNPHVFWGREPGEPLRADQGNTVKTLQRHGREVAKAENLAEVFAAPFSAHDLRRTVVSGMAKLGVDQHLADRIISHSDSTLSTVAKTYQRHTFDKEARAALERWTRHVIDLGEGRQPEKVVPMRRA